MQHTTIIAPYPQIASAAAAPEMVPAQEHQEEIQQKQLSALPIQCKLSVGAADDPLEDEADAVADKVMRMPEQNFVQKKCASCEEDKVQRSTADTMIQRSLAVTNTSPPNIPVNDRANTIPLADKISHFRTIMQGLCPSFTVNPGGTVVPVTNPPPSAATLSAGSHPLGCCGLNILVNGVNNWEIQTSELIGPHTSRGRHTFVLPPHSSDITFGHFTAAGTRANLNDIMVAGHEIIGHGAQNELGIHNQGSEDREALNHHDPTINIQNIVAHEQGIPVARDRGLAASGIHRGESFAKVEIIGFPFNSSDITQLSPAEQNKIKLMADFILTNGEWVDVIGHSDPVGSNAANQQVSDNRANAVKARLIQLGVTQTFSKTTLPTYQYINRPRFTRVAGVRDTQPPATGIGNHANWRRVEIFAVNHPMGAEVPPNDIPALGSATPGANLATARASADPCHRLLTNSAFPVPAAAPAVQPKLQMGVSDNRYEREADSIANQVMQMPEASFIQRKCSDCEEEKVQRKPLAHSITPFIQTKGAEGGIASDGVSSQITASKGSGRSLDAPAKSFMESRFGSDFSDVRIHTGDYAVQMSRELNAQAFTVGNDIYFNNGKYAPESTDGKHLLAHELTHTVQQSGRVTRSIQRTVRPSHVSCHSYPRTYPIFASIGTTDPLGAIQSADARAIEMLTNAIETLNQGISRIQAGASPAWPTINDCIAQSIQVRLLIDPANAASWTNRGPGTVQRIVQMFTNLRGVFQGGGIRYSCLGQDCEAGDDAYRIRGEGYRIHLCDGFWKSNNDARASTLVHELAHIYYGTRDYGFLGPGSSYCLEGFLCDLNGVALPPAYQGTCRGAQMDAC